MYENGLVIRGHPDVLCRQARHRAPGSWPVGRSSSCPGSPALFRPPFTAGASRPRTSIARAARSRATRAARTRTAWTSGSRKSEGDSPARPWTFTSRPHGGDWRNRRQRPVVGHQHGRDLLAVVREVERARTSVAMYWPRRHLAWRVRRQIGDPDVRACPACGRNRRRPCRRVTRSGWTPARWAISAADGTKNPLPFRPTRACRTRPGRPTARPSRTSSTPTTRRTSG